MHQSRIAELLEPFLEATSNQKLTPDDLQRISTYIDILQHWNSRTNLTAIRDEEEIVTRHFGESLFAARHLFPTRVVADASIRHHEILPEAGSPKPEARLADLGSGAGFPGLPIKLWAPNLVVTLIESNNKKATFLREVVRTLTLTNVDIQNVRAETITPAGFDVVTIRAVERFANVLPIAAGLLGPGGRLALLLSSSQQTTARSALPGMTWNPSISIQNSDSRQLLIGER